MKITKAIFLILLLLAIGGCSVQNKDVVLNNEIDKRQQYGEENKKDADFVTLNPHFKYYYSENNYSIPQIYDLGFDVKTPDMLRKDNIDVYADMSYKGYWFLNVCILTKDGELITQRLRGLDPVIKIDKNFPFGGFGYVLVYYNSHEDENNGSFINFTRFHQNCVQYLNETPTNPNRNKMYFFELNVPNITEGITYHFRADEFASCSVLVDNYFFRECETCYDTINSKTFLKYYDNKTCCQIYLEKYAEEKSKLKDELVCT